MNIVVLGSGRGSNARAILQAEKEGRLGKAKVVGILCDVADAPMLDLGAAYNVPARFIDPAPFKTKLEGEAEQNYIKALNDWSCELVVLAGFMRVVKKGLLEAYDGRIINLHPSLLPKHPGLHSIQRAFEAGDEETGCTVHWVNAVVDGGGIIGQSTVCIEKTDTLETVEDKVHAAEHQLLPSVIAELSKKQ